MFSGAGRLRRSHVCMGRAQLDVASHDVDDVGEDLRMVDLISEPSVQRHDIAHLKGLIRSQIAIAYKPSIPFIHQVEEGRDLLGG